MRTLKSLSSRLESQNLQEIESFSFIMNENCQCLSVQKKERKTIFFISKLENITVYTRLKLNEKN